MQLKKIKKAMAAGFLLFSLTLAPQAQAALNAVDPAPYPTTTGLFPVWYQDSFGRALELCLSSAEIAPNAARGLVGGAACTLLANPGIFDPALPLSFPDNFPDESFWFMGDATINAGGVSVTYVANLEAAFGAGDPAPNDQIAFARIRIRVTLPNNAPVGNYTLIHPYGVDVFDVVAGGVKAINMTRDIGIGAPGVFTGALRGDIGPFLVDASVPTVGLIPSSIPGEFYIGDPNSLRPVVGSPFGTNFVRLEGPTGFTPVQTNLFSVMGKVYAGALPTPLAIERSSYSIGLNGVSAQQDIFAKAPPSSSSVTFLDSFGTPGAMTDGNADGGWFGQSPAEPTLPDTISVTAVNPANNNTSVTRSGPLVDLVTISRAEYSGGTLIVEAASSDEANLPLLEVNGQDLVPIGAGPLQTLTISGLTIPPARVTVTSRNGGSDTEEVILLP